MARAAERYGLDLHPPDLQRLALKIERGNPKNARKITDVRGYDANYQSAAWLVLYDEQWLLALYSPRLRRIMSFLPLGCSFSDDGRIEFT